jgi:hypothetical protein
MSQETIHQAFQVVSPARLNLSNIRGSVEILAGGADLVQVTAIKHTETGDAENTEIELSQAADGSVVAATHFPEGWWLWLLGSRPCRVDYRVEVPQGSQLKLKGVENSVLVEGLAGQFDLSSISGDLTLRNLTGPVRINTVSGDVLAAQLTGVFELVTVSGDLETHETHLTALNAKTVSGNLSLETSLSTGPYTFNSVSGDVRLLLPAEARFSARLHTISGDLSSQFPGTNFSRGHGSASVEVQGGGVRLEARSVSGNLRLRPVGEAPRAPSLERREILERLERGEIQPDEALAQLKT